MAFHEVRFPDNISRGARGGPERRTQIVELASGDEERNASWANSRRRYDVAYGIRRSDDLAAVVAFFEARNGRLHGFRFKDWGDHKSCLPSATPAPTDQAIGTGDGATTTFQLVKRYASGSQTWVRTIAKPVADTVWPYEEVAGHWDELILRSFAVIDGDRIVAEERLLGELDARIRDVRAGADGNLYVLTDEDDGRLLRVVPPQPR